MYRRDYLTAPAFPSGPAPPSGFAPAPPAGSAVGAAAATTPQPQDVSPSERPTAAATAGLGRTGGGKSDNHRYSSSKQAADAALGPAGGVSRRAERLSLPGQADPGEDGFTRLLVGLKAAGAGGAGAAAAGAAGRRDAGMEAARGVTEGYAADTAAFEGHGHGRGIPQPSSVSMRRRRATEGDAFSLEGFMGVLWDASHMSHGLGSFKVHAAAC